MKENRDIILESQEYKDVVEALDIAEMIDFSDDSTEDQESIREALVNVELKLKGLFQFIRDPHIRENSDPLNILKLLARSKKIAAKLFKTIPGNEGQELPRTPEDEILEKMIELGEKRNVKYQHVETPKINPDEVKFKNVNIDKSF